jgi:hypothetical protein
VFSILYDISTVVRVCRESLQCVEREREVLAAVCIEEERGVVDTLCRKRQPQESYANITLFHIPFE